MSSYTRCFKSPASGISIVVYSDNTDEGLKHRCICYHFPKYATRISQHKTTRPSVGDEKLHINSLQLGKKKYVQCIFMGGM